MALSGIFYGTTTNERVKPKILWSAVQDIGGNWSDVTASLYYSRTNNTSDVTAGQWVGSITIDGDTRQESKRLSISYDSNTLAITHTARVYHDEYGAKTLTVSATGGISISSMKETDIRAVITLDTIPRATAIAADGADIESNLLIHLHRYNDSFTHSIEYRFGALGGYIDPDGNACPEEVKFSHSTPWFKLPAEFYGQMPDAPAGEGRLYCRTYLGDTQIGQTQETSFTARASERKCRPDVICRAEDTNPKTVALTGDPNIIVKNHSVVHCQVTGIPKNGAGMDMAMVNNVPVALDENGHGQADIPVATGELTFRVVDSRGFSATECLRPICIDYVELTCRASVSRVDPGSRRAQLTVEGKFFNDTFTAVHNTLSLRCSVDGGEAFPIEVQPGQRDYAVTVALENLEYQSSHALRVWAEDKLMNLEVPVVIGKNTPVFDWGEHDFRFHVPVFGDFYGNVQGLSIRTLQLQGETTIRLQSKWEDFNYDYESGIATQGIFLLGNVGSMSALGLLTLYEDENGSWSGNGEIGISSIGKGQFELYLPSGTYGGLALLSAEPFEIVL